MGHEGRSPELGIALPGGEKTMGAAMDNIETRRKGFSGWLILLALIVGFSAGYLGGSITRRPLNEGAVIRKIAPETPGEPLSGSTSSEATKIKPAEGVQEGRPSSPSSQNPYEGLTREQYCSRVQAEISDFFSYVGNQPYYKHLAGDKKAQELFKETIRRLASRLPIPGGEGVDTSIIINNIYYIFRSMNRNVIRLIKEFISSEGESLELDMALFYRWIMLGDECGEGADIRPSFQELYHFAGFFLNTIGGRAYLLRRPAAVGALTGYYCLLILHEANLTGRNNYGIDILPYIATIKEEIASARNLVQSEDYLIELSSMENYYQQRR